MLFVQIEGEMCQLWSVDLREAWERGDPRIVTQDRHLVIFQIKSKALQCTCREVSLNLL